MIDTNIALNINAYGLVINLVTQFFKKIPGMSDSSQAHSECFQLYRNVETPTANQFGECSCYISFLKSHDILKKIALMFFSI